MSEETSLPFEVYARWNAKKDSVLLLWGLSTVSDMDRFSGSLPFWSGIVQTWRNVGVGLSLLWNCFLCDPKGPIHSMLRCVIQVKLKAISVLSAFAILSVFCQIGNNTSIGGLSTTDPCVARHNPPFHPGARKQARSSSWCMVLQDERARATNDIGRLVVFMSGWLVCPLISLIFFDDAVLETILFPSVDLWSSTRLLAWPTAQVKRKLCKGTSIAATPQLGYQWHSHDFTW